MGSIFGPMKKKAAYAEPSKRTATRERHTPGSNVPKLRCVVCGRHTPVGDIRTGVFRRQPERGKQDVCIDCYQEAPEGSIQLIRPRILGA